MVFLSSVRATRFLAKRSSSTWLSLRKPAVHVEPRADREDSGFDHALVAMHRRRWRIGIVDGKFVGASPQTSGGVIVLDHLKIVDVDGSGSVRRKRRNWVRGLFDRPREHRHGAGPWQPDGD
jgi:hypothetical protein